MTHEAKRALERIVEACEKSDNLSMTQIRIYDFALEGLGYTAGQRGKMIEKWKRPHIEKMEARRDRQAARYQEAA
ncbi:MAG TPA: hypothetical protein VFS02_20195 [Telluria sp.]|nr:hypothetical protein [Telluria sp.]